MAGGDSTDARAHRRTATESVAHSDRGDRRKEKQQWRENFQNALERIKKQLTTP
jgi:hypothetical protein